MAERRGSWWVTRDDDEFRRRQRAAAERMATERKTAGVRRALDEMFYREAAANAGRIIHRRQTGE